GGPGTTKPEKDYLCRNVLISSKLLPQPYLGGTTDQLGSEPNRSSHVGRVAVVEIQVQLRIDFPSHEALVRRGDRYRDRHRRHSRSVRDHVAVGEHRESRFEADAIGSERCAEPSTGLQPQRGPILETHQSGIIAEHGAREAEARSGLEKARPKLILVLHIS